MRLEDLTPAIMIIVLVGVLLGVGLYTLSETRESIATDRIGSDIHQNMNGSNGLGLTNTTTLSDASKTGYLLKSVQLTHTASNTVLVNNVNYTWTDAGVITMLPATAILGKGNNTMNVTSVFIYDATDSPESALTSAVAGIDDFAAWIAIIVVVLAAAIVLGIVLTSFGRTPSA